MDHRVDAVDVDAAGGDVGGDQRRGLTLLERGEGAITLALAATAVDRFGGDAVTTELLGEAVGAVTGAGEHDRRTETLDHVGGGRHAFLAIDQPEVVLGGVHVRALRADLVTHGVVLEVGHELGDGAVEGGREQQHLAVVRGLLDDAADRGQKAHVGHLVGFVDHHGGDVAQVDGSHLHQVLETTGAGDDEFDAAVERLALAAVADPAVDRSGIVAGSLRERGQLGHDLLGEFTGRGQHEGDWSLRAGVGEAGDEREPEAEGLSRAGRRAAGNVAAGERVGDDGGLDREGGVLALALEPVHDRVGQAEVAEGNRCVGSVGGRDARGVVDDGHWGDSSM